MTVCLVNSVCDCSRISRSVLGNLKSQEIMNSAERLWVRSINDDLSTRVRMFVIVVNLSV